MGTLSGHLSGAPFGDPRGASPSVLLRFSLAPPSAIPILSLITLPPPGLSGASCLLQGLRAASWGFRGPTRASSGFRWDLLGPPGASRAPMGLRRTSTCWGFSGMPDSRQLLTTQEAYTMVPRRPKRPPRQPQDGKENAKIAQEGSKTAAGRLRVAPKTALEVPKEPKAAQTGP